MTVVSRSWFAVPVFDGAGSRLQTRLEPLQPLINARKQTFWETFVRLSHGPDVTRPNITTRTYTHTHSRTRVRTRARVSAHKQVPPPGGFLVPNMRLDAWGGVKKEKQAECAGCVTASPASVALVITAAAARDSTRPRACACMCVRATGQRSPAEEYRAVLFTPACCPPPPRGWGRTVTCEDLFPRTAASHLARPFDFSVKGGKRGEREKIPASFPVVSFSLLPVSLIFFKKLRWPLN